MEDGGTQRRAGICSEYPLSLSLQPLTPGSQSSIRLSGRLPASQIPGRGPSLLQALGTAAAQLHPQGLEYGEEGSPRPGGPTAGSFTCWDHGVRVLV